MILVKIKLDKSLIHGLGCFTKESIQKGQKIWEFNPEFDLVVEKEVVERLPEGAKENFLNYAYVGKGTGQYVLCSDDSKFFNHADENQNVTCFAPEDAVGNELVCVATRDISAGEELTCDYQEFDAEPYDVII